ncbi:MAG TPA: exopolysaccharide biosynthesis glycosyltransferase EpsD [Myxococcales bacterium]|nr:exopolysaccharide biosynthesis glycosyltransferase EpsD [Myxococcales bacterium]
MSATDQAQGGAEVVLSRRADGDGVRPRISLVIATFNRRPLLERLLRQLDAQALPPSEFEVVVVDDGSREPVAPALDTLEVRYPLRVLRQANAGVARARHQGVLHARGDVLVIVDDDMQVPPEFLKAHLDAHAGPEPTAVFARIRPDPGLAKMPVFERFHAASLEKWTSAVKSGQAKVVGNNLCTGNVSMRRADYLAVGGFDQTLERSEDAELGLRLEKAGVKLVFAEEPYTTHSSDHTELKKWLGRCYRYGLYELRIARKHPDLLHADPWRYLFSLHPVLRPLMALSVAGPGLSAPLAQGLIRAAMGADRLGLERAAVRATMVVYGMEYFRGIRAEAGSMAGAVKSLQEFLVKAAAGGEGAAGVPRSMAAASKMLADLQADLDVRREYEDRYGYQGEKGGSLPQELVQKIGLQLSAACRLMRFFRDSGFTLGAKVTSRMIRHLYGSDIHWDADLDPGVMFVHGMGLAISGAAKVGPGCILFQHVTLGMGNHPDTRQHGAPTLQARVHVAPGATLLGPITIGEGSKIMPGVVVIRDVPPGSVVEAPVPVVRSRPGKGPKAEGAEAQAPARPGAAPERRGN